MTLVLLAIGWLLGIAAVALWSAPWWAGAAILACFMVGGAAWRQRPSLPPVAAAMLLAALVSGLLFARWEARPGPEAAQYLDRTITFSGTVVSEGVASETSTAYVASIEHVRTKAGWVATSGKVRISAGQYASYLPGDIVEMTGKLEAAPVFEDFDYRAYLARHDIVGTMYRPATKVTRPASATNPAAVIARARLRLDASLQHALPEPAASLAGGIAFGRDSGIPDEQYSDFRSTGLAHIVAVSGSNVSLLAALAFALLVPVAGRRWALLPAGLLVAAYVVMAGASASVVRAGIMAAILLFGEWIGRPQSSLPGLAAAVILMTAVQPSAAIDVGFQLSVAATAGLIAFGPWLRWALERWLRRGPGRALPDLVFESGALTLAATVGTLPITWVNFGRVSLVSPGANVLAAPAVLVALPLAMLTAVLGTVSAPLGWAAGLVTYCPVALIIAIARGLASVPGASIPVPGISGTAAGAAMVALSGAGWLGYRHLAPALPDGDRAPKSIVRWRWAIGTALAAGSLVLIIRMSLIPIGGPGRFEMRALDVGQGDAILLTTPHGHTMLVDGGVSGMVLARQLGEVLPHWDRSIDIVFLTHPDGDHVGGLPGVLRRFEVANTWDTGVSGTSGDAAVYAAEAGRHTVREGDHFELDGVRVDVLWPPASTSVKATNASSLVLRVTFGNTRFLLTGDLEAREQDEMMRAEDVSADVLKVPHHGSKTSDPAFFDAVGANLAVISVGAGNPYGHPAPSTLEALSSETVLRTDLAGRVTVYSDGTGIGWDVQR